MSEKYESDTQKDELFDPFFIEVEQDAPVEKRPVMRDGRVPKLQKNFEKLQ